jgi:hypothetical protein
VDAFKVYKFNEEDLKKLKAREEDMPPFAIIGSLVSLTDADLSRLPLAAEGTDASSIARPKVGDPCRKYKWGTALPYSRDHSDFIILQQLLTGNGNHGLKHLLNDSWARACAFFPRYQQLQTMQGSKRKGQAKASLSLEPLVDEVCAGFGPRNNGQQSLQDKLRCEEQHRLEHKLAQAQRTAQRMVWVLIVAVCVGFLLGVALAPYKPCIA